MWDMEKETQSWFEHEATRKESHHGNEKMAETHGASPADFMFAIELMETLEKEGYTGAPTEPAQEQPINNPTQLLNRERAQSQSVGDQHRRDTENRLTGSVAE
jgi:hypothetical protein